MMAPELTEKQRIQGYSKHAGFTDTLKKGDHLITLAERSPVGYKNPPLVTYSHNARDDSIGRDCGEITTRDLVIGPVVDVRARFVRGMPALMCKIPSMTHGPRSYCWVLACGGFRSFVERMDPRLYLVSPLGEVQLPTGVEKELFNKHLALHENSTGFNQFAENNADGTRARAGEHFTGGDSVRVYVWDGNLAAGADGVDGARVNRKTTGPVLQ